MRTGELYQRYYGVFAGTVIDVEDPEKLGRVRIECDQYEDAEDDVFWANVARPAAGNRTGVFFTPKTGDQVIVGYLAGDVGEPVVLGYAHSQKRRPPEQVTPRKHAVVTDIGHVVFDEEGGNIRVTFNTPESFIQLDKDGITISAPKVKIVSTAPGAAGIELRSQVAPIRIASPLAVGLLAPVIALGGAPSFGAFAGIDAELPEVDLTKPVVWDFSQLQVGVEVKTGGKEFCVNQQGILL
jgi:phage baseplate assembly protein gpV